MGTTSPATVGPARHSAASAASFRSDDLLAIKTAKLARLAPPPLSLSALSTHAAFDESDLRPPSLVSDRTSTVSSTASPRLSLALPSPFPLLPLFPPKFQPYAHDVFGDDSESVFEQRTYAAPSPVLLRSGFAGARAVSSSTATAGAEGEERRRETSTTRRKHHSVVPVKGVTTPHGTPRTERFPDLHRPLPPLPPGLAAERPTRPKSKSKSKDKARVHRSTTSTRPAPLDPAPAPPMPPTPVTPYAGVAHSPAPVERDREHEPPPPARGSRASTASVGAQDSADFGGVGALFVVGLRIERDES
ncbi:uncharacterized protein LOC62_01G001403 [Vanrija pseudolonga]|uniref:Uncharacterized protein n=1 Tax=Vanrija pseudolonga TaxID=143232 RepID=A0AAF1BFB9_9TREE|nr:hypothetical protein LOC62_01G001403 [Vanrija pseudolonga]